MGALTTDAPRSEETLDPAGDPDRLVRGERFAWRREAAAFIGFLAFTVYATWPLTAEISTRVPSNLIDPLLNVWIFSWAAHAIAHSPLELFHANIFYPDHLTL